MLARPLPTPIRIADDRSAATVGVAATLYPEWDVFADRYRPDWCRVITAPLAAAPDTSAASLIPDDELRRRLSRVGRGPRVLRARADGDELDTDALIRAITDVTSGHSSTQNIYTERRYIARDLGVLVLLDTSGSVTDTDPNGLAVHEHQRQVAATLTATLEELGDRVALYAFRSHGRHDVHLLSVKTFEQRFHADARTRLNRLQPSGYTRLGAAIRGAADVLKTRSGTPSRLLLVLSDGFPYDHGYEGRYAEADAHKALEELRADGVACLCLSLASDPDPTARNRVFGAASHATAATLADLTPRIDELFLCALRELATAK
jgi:nitric oxide reductase NorD protein